MEVPPLGREVGQVEGEVRPPASPSVTLLRPGLVCRRFGTKCAGCAQGISPSDLVRKARSKVFHLNCFTCMVCNKQLSTGEELYVIDENKFVCKDDYLSSASLKEGSLNSGRGRAGGWGREVGAETTLQRLVSPSSLTGFCSHCFFFLPFWSLLQVQSSNPPLPALELRVVSSSTGRPLKAEDGEVTC